MSSSNDATAVPAIVLLAAGEGRRYGGIKQLADIDGQPMVRRVASVVLDTGMPVIVVTGAQAERVEAALAGLPLEIVRHAGWQAGMGSSIAAGIRHLLARIPAASAVLLCLADQPLIDAELLRRMAQRHREAPDRLLVTRCLDVSGPPVLFPGDCLAVLAAWSGASGAFAVVEQEAARVEWFDSTRPIDVDTPADLQDALAALATMRNRT
jgi:molybdenum cofactor cytidylyltransferase